MGVEPTVHGFADRCQQPVGVTADYVPPPGFEPGLWVPKTRVLPLHQGGMCANASDTYARLRSAMPIQPVFADWIPGPIPWPITADRLADGARVELARDFRPNSLSRTAPLPHGPPSMPVFRRAGTPGEALTFCELPRRMRVPPILLRAPTRIRTGTACPPSPGHGGVPSPSTRTAGRGSAVSLCVSRVGDTPV